NLSRGGGEDRGGRHALRDERRQSSERRLLVGTLTQLVLSLSIRERGCQEGRERGQPLLGAGGKKVPPPGGDAHDTPNPGPPADRRGDRRAPATPQRNLGGLARANVIAVDPRRTLRLRNERQHVVAADGRTRSHKHFAWQRAPASDRRR